jgi:hypothetical protein
MIAKGIIHGMTRKPTREDVAKWVNNAMAKMQGDRGLVGNEWLKTGFEWFDKSN